MSAGTNTTTSTNQPPQQFLDAYQNVLGQAQNVASQPTQTYGGNLVAGFSPEQVSAINTVNNAQGVATPYINSAAQDFNSATQPLWSGVQQFSGGTPTAGQSGAPAGATPQPSGGGAGQAAPAASSAPGQGGVAQYESPYTQQVVNATQAQFNNQNQQTSQQLTNNAVAQGAYGGSRAAVAQGVAAGQEQAAQAPVIAGLENQGYSQALGEFNTQQQSQLGANEANAWLNSQAAFGLGSLGQEAQNTALSGASAQLQTGALEQSLGQEQLNVPYEQWLGQQAAPYQNTQWLANIAEGTGGASGGTGSSSSSTTPSVTQDITGLGTAGLGAASLLGFLKHGGGVALHPTHPAHRSGGGGIAGNDNWHPEPEQARAYGGVAGYAAGGTPAWAANAMAQGVAGLGPGGAGAAPGWKPPGGVASPAGTAISPELGGSISVSMAPTSHGSPVPVMSFHPSIGGVGGTIGGSGLSSADQAYFSNNLASAKPPAATTGEKPYQPNFVTDPNSVASQQAAATAAAGALPKSLWSAALSGGANAGNYGHSPDSGLANPYGGGNAPLGFGTTGAGVASGISAPGQRGFSPGIASGEDSAAAGAGGGFGGGFSPGAASGADGGDGVARGGIIGRDDGGDIPVPPIPPPGGVAGAGEPASPYAVNYTPPTGGDPNEVANIRAHAPGLGLLAAGLGILGGRSLNGAANIGEGALQGLKVYQGETQRADQLAEKQGEQANEGQYRKANLDLEARRLSDAADQAKATLAQTSKHETAMEGIEQSRVGMEGARLAQERELAMVPPEVRTFQALQGMTPEQRAAFTNFQAVQKGLLPVATADQFGGTAAAAQPSGPAAAGANPQAATAPAGATTGDSFLQRLPPNVQTTVKAIAEGRMALPGRLTPQTEQLIGLVGQYDPTFDQSDYNKRSRTATDFSAGQSNKAVGAINTAMGHLETLDKAFDALGNGDIPALNAVGNWWANQTGSPLPNNASEARNAVSNELRKVFATTGGGGLEELREWQSNFPLNGSPAQQKDAIRGAIALMDGRMSALADRYSQGMGTNHTGADLLSPEARAAYQHLTGQAPESDQARAPTNVRAAQPQQQPAQAAPQIAIPPMPAGLPAGSQYSPSRHAWRDPSGKIYPAGP